MRVLPLTLAVLLLVLTGRFGYVGLRRLAQMRLRGGELALLAGLAQLANLLTHQYRLIWLALTAILLARFCWLNRHQTGFWLITLGVVLNLGVMAANGAVMPTNPVALTQMSGLHVASGTPLLFTKARVMDDGAATLAWLGDRLLLPGPLAHLAVWSIGDVIVLVGVWRLLWTTMKGRDHVTDPLRYETLSS